MLILNNAGVGFGLGDLGDSSVEDVDVYDGGGNWMD